MMKIISSLPSPEQLKKEHPISNTSHELKKQRDIEISDIFNGISKKFLLIVGPCSADNPDAVLEYTCLLADIAKEVSDSIIIIPRVYTAKPRTASSGYMGLVHETNGIESARRLHLDVLKTSGLSSSDELLYPALYPYFDDIISYYAIGARSSENQEHRLVASGIDIPVGIKNPMCGNLESLTKAVCAVKTPHSIIYGGNIIQTDGNSLAHVVLRGGLSPNYHEKNLMHLYQTGQHTVIIDTNHGNSGKNPAKQPGIAREILSDMRKNPVIKGLVKGLMIESYLKTGSQAEDGKVYGMSITDACLGFEETRRLIYDIAELL